MKIVKLQSSYFSLSISTSHPDVNDGLVDGIQKRFHHNPDPLCHICGAEKFHVIHSRGA